MNTIITIDLETLPALDMYRDGEHDLAREYCRVDVEQTREVWRVLTGRA